MTDLVEHPPLRVDLPDDLFWLDADVRALQRPAAHNKTSKGVLQPGATRRCGLDLPADAAWARGREPEDFYVHHQDGESFCLQLNLADISAQVRKPEWPAVGVLWVVFEQGKRFGYDVTVHFDPRPASHIPWRHRAEPNGEVTTWEVQTQLPWATEKTIPLLANWAAMATVYDNWVQEHYTRRRRGRGGMTLGGYGFTHQGDFDEDSEEFVLSIEDLHFGDCGEVYVFFNPERGFYGRADIC